MNIKNSDISKIIPYARNPRKNDSAISKVMASLKEFGFQQPIVVDKDNVIIVGHTRYLAAQKLGIKEIPVQVAEHLTEAQCKAYRIADNKVGEIAEWDNELLRLEFEDLENFDYDLDLTGFELGEIEALTPTVGDSEHGGSETVKEQSIAVSVIGDIWVLGENTLCCNGGNLKQADRVIEFWEGMTKQKARLDSLGNKTFEQIKNERNV
jgi:ParB-like chromosome segregation protein Spo0J